MRLLAVEDEPDLAEAVGAYLRNAGHAVDLARRGITEIAVISPAFSADCIETLEEIQGEIREAFVHAGGREFTYIPCLNADPDHIDTLTAIVADNLGGWL